MTEPINVENVFEAAWSTLSEQDQHWLGKDKFDILCNAIASGVKHRDLHKSLGQTRRLLRGQKAEQTRRFKIIFTTPLVLVYINLIEDPDTMSWTDWIDTARAMAQRILSKALELPPGEKPDKEAIKLATRILEQDVGKPKERIEIDHGGTVTFEGLERIADGLPEGILLPTPEDLSEMVDVEVIALDQGEREAGERSGPSDTPLLPEPGAVDGPPVSEPTEVDGGGRVGREESPSS